jgi:hypothetical protein
VRIGAEVFGQPSGGAPRGAPEDGGLMKDVETGLRLPDPHLIGIATAEGRYFS